MMASPRWRLVISWVLVAVSRADPASLPTIDRLMGFDKRLRIAAGAQVEAWPGRGRYMVIALGGPEAGITGTPAVLPTRLTTPGESVAFRHFRDLPAASISTHPLVRYPEIAR